jgi:hypothetical protein
MCIFVVYIFVNNGVLFIKTGPSLVPIKSGGRNTSRGEGCRVDSLVSPRQEGGRLVCFNTYQWVWKSLDGKRKNEKKTQGRCVCVMDFKKMCVLLSLKKSLDFISVWSILTKVTESTVGYTHFLHSPSSSVKVPLSSQVGNLF